jgi:hypothetical protein
VPKGLIKIPRKEPLLADDKFEIGLLVMLMVAPPVTEIPLTIDAAVADVEEISVRVFVSIDTAVPFDERIAVTIFPVLDNADTVLLVIDLLADADESSMPNTIPDVEEVPVILFKLMLCVGQGAVFEM